MGYPLRKKKKTKGSQNSPGCLQEDFGEDVLGSLGDPEFREILSGRADSQGSLLLSAGGLEGRFSKTFGSVPHLMKGWPRQRQSI